MAPSQMTESGRERSVWFQVHRVLKRTATGYAPCKYSSAGADELVAEEGECAANI